MVGALSVDQLFDSIAIRVNGPKAWDEHLTIDWVFTDLGHTYRTELTNGVLIQDVDPTGGSRRPHRHAHQAAAPRAARRRAASTASRPTATPASSRRLLAVLDRPNPNFPIVTP